METLAIFLIFLSAATLIVAILNFIVNLFKKKKNKVSRYALLTSIISIVALLVVAIIGSSLEEDTDTPSVEVSAEDEDDLEDYDDYDLEDEELDDTSIDWETVISDIAVAEQSATEKYDAVEGAARDFVPDSSELEEFADDIITTYQSGNYLNLEEKEQLTQIFKSSVLDRNESGSLKDFAFDYLQVQKYVYRGAEQPDGQFVKENEYQMDKALLALKNK